MRNWTLDFLSYGLNRPVDLVHDMDDNDVNHIKWFFPFWQHKLQVRGISFHNNIFRSVKLKQKYNSGTRFEWKPLALVRDQISNRLTAKKIIDSSLNLSSDRILKSLINISRPGQFHYVTNISRGPGSEINP